MSVERPSLLKKIPFTFFKKGPLGTGKVSAKKSKQRRILIYGIIALLILATVAVNSLKPLSGTLITVQPQEFIKGFTEEGQILAAREWPQYNTVNAKITSVSVQNGDKVEQGQVLLELNTQDLTYQLEALEAQRKSVEGQRLQAYSNPYPALIQQQNLLIAQAEKDNSAQEGNLARSKALYEAGALPLVQYEEAQRQAERAKNFLTQQKTALALIYEQHQPQQGTEQFYAGQIEALTAQIAQLEEQIAQGHVTAPADGFIKDLNLKEGEWVTPGQLLLNLYQSSSYKVESYVLASEASAIKPGDSVKTVQDSSLEDLVLAGQIEYVEPAAVERISPLGLKENRVKVSILLQSETPLIIGSTLDVDFITHQESAQIMVPKSALFPYGEGEAVWVVRAGVATIQPVVKGMENNREVIIQEGLATGEQVLLDTDLPGLKEGKKIKAL
ncbi:efflux RND transporter periplasmic adaptor subunit [Desulfitobacterium sp. THU1]|uniref:efflux RND transporter periplasmic adaptor subunit n=1 Tax=Desulfitobacterium sp. THU1 TaxID=3138072 RepID=UPI00311F5A6E